MNKIVIKSFFNAFRIGKPMLKVWRYSGYYEDYSWDSELIDCSEVLKRNNWTIEELDKLIQTSKQEEKEKNSELYDYRFDSIETEFGKTTSALVEYPSVTNTTLMELMGILTRNCYKLEIFNALMSDGTEEYVVNLIKEPTRYHSHSEDFGDAILKSITLLSDDEDVMTEVKALFEEE